MDLVKLSFANPAHDLLQLERTTNRDLGIWIVLLHPTELLVHEVESHLEALIIFAVSLAEQGRCKRSDPLLAVDYPASFL